MLSIRIWLAAGLFLVLGTASAYAHQPLTATKPAKKVRVCRSELNENPFLAYDGVSPFPYDQLKAEHFEPAMDWALKIARKNLKVIVKNAERPSFENTIEPLETMDEEAQLVYGVLHHLYNLKSSRALSRIYGRIKTMMDQWRGEVESNQVLQDRLKKLKDRGPRLPLTSEEKTLFELMLAGVSKADTHLEKPTSTKESDSTVALNEAFKVISGAAESVFFIRFVERFDLPKWHASVRVYEVLDQQSRHRGLFYFDPLARKGKTDANYVGSMISGGLYHGEVRRPHVLAVTNFSSAALLSEESVSLLARSMGTALHLLLGQSRYASIFSLKGMSLESRELPAKVFEQWALHGSGLLNSNSAKWFELLVLGPGSSEPMNVLMTRFRDRELGQDVPQQLDLFQ